MPLVGFGVRAAEMGGLQFHYEMKRVKRRAPSRAVSGQAGWMVNWGGQVAAVCRSWMARRSGCFRNCVNCVWLLLIDWQTALHCVQRRHRCVIWLVFGRLLVRRTLGVSGVGEVKMQRYGERFDVIRAVGERSGR